jgi:hypothetical protein
MVPPFSREAFMWAFAVYNESVWPMQFVLVALGVAALGIAPRRGLFGPAGWILALLWAWMALFYHAGVFSTVTPAAYLFAAAFLVQAALLARAASGTRARLAIPGPLARGVGWSLALYALIGYPLLGLGIGHRYPFAPSFGVPCPTTILTLALLVLSPTRVPLHLLIVPVLWAMVGVSAAVSLGMVEDLMLPVAAVAAVIVLSLRSRAVRRAAPTPRPITAC